MFNRQSIHIALLLWGCIFCLIAALCMSLNREMEQKKRKYMMLLMQLSCSILLASDATAWAFRGSAGSWERVIVYVSNYLVFTFSDVLLLFYHGYVCDCLFEHSLREDYIHEQGGKADYKHLFHSETQKKRSLYNKLQKKYSLYSESQRSRNIRVRLVYMIGTTAILLVFLSQFTNLYYYIDSQNYYHRNPAYFLSVLLPMVGMLLDLSLLIQYRKNVSRELLVAMTSYIVLPFVTAAAQIFYYGISLINIAISISMILMFLETMIEQGKKVARQERMLAEQEHQLAEQDRILAQTERELTESRITSMLSQIRNHFIFNTLSVISGYCKIDPEKADEALTRFARYLRRNMGYLETSDLIFFETEVAQIEDYVSLEQMRFGDMVEFGEDFEVTDFRIPPLTVQPLVENAIKHGLTKPGKQGSVCILTRREKGFILIEVVDDGVGFEPEELEKETSIGIRNICYRLQHMANAELRIDSTPGKGTKAVIRIPEEKQ